MRQLNNVYINLCWETYTQIANVLVQNFWFGSHRLLQFHKLVAVYS